MAVRTCKTCRHPQRETIERQLLQGVPMRELASRYKLGRMSLERHMSRGHISKEVAEAFRLKRLAHSEDLLLKTKELQVEALEILRRAKAAVGEEGTRGALNLALGALGRATALLELQGKLMGELAPERDFGALIGLVIGVLRDHPEPLVKLIAALRTQGVDPAALEAWNGN